MHHKVPLAHNVSFWGQKLTYYVSFWRQNQKLTLYVSFWPQKLMFCVSFWRQKLTHYISFWGQRFLSQKLTFYVSFWSQKLTLWVSFWSQKLIHNNGFWIRYNKINFDLPSIISQDFISPRDSCPRRHLSKETLAQGNYFIYPKTVDIIFVNV